jgi:tetrahydromethanopterin S-methyltransferase subunit F
MSDKQLHDLSVGVVWFAIGMVFGGALMAVMLRMAGAIL